LKALHQRIYARIEDVTVAFHIAVADPLEQDRANLTTLAQALVVERIDGEDG
jgi:hypothetical protein